MPTAERVLPVTRESAQSSTPHILSLDGFRGLAILLVLFFHVALVSSNDRGAVVGWLGHVRQSGWIGVEMFFTLSGFLITGILLRTVTDPHYLSSFYIRRTLRIFPLYYGVLLLLCVVGWILHLSWNGSLPFLLCYLQNFRTGGEHLRLEMSNATMTVPLQHFWSLAVEEQFYLVWPFLVLMTRGRRVFVWVPVFFVVVCPGLRWIAYSHGVSFAALRYWTLFHVDSLAWGGLGAAAQKFFTAKHLRAFRLVTVAAGGLLTVRVMLAEHGYLLEGAAPSVRFFYTSFGAFCSGLILTMVHGETLVARFFRMAFLRWFGRYSYGIYVIHLLFMSLYERLRSYVDVVTGSRALGALTLVVSAFGVSAALAWISFHGYERYFLNLKDKLGGYAVPKRLSRR